jgi:cellulose synthase/poly-beta-1,6-N-acetylglucosamine synthase-like glycosyltransferase
LIAVSFLLFATALVLYVIVGYPLLLVRWRRFAPPIRKAIDFAPRVTVVLAVYNGAQFLHRKLENILALNYPPGLLEVVVVSDGSTDATEEIARSFASWGVSLFVVPHGGKAVSLNEAMKHATGEILLFVDVRQTLDRDALKHLVANFADPTVGAVTGELRFLHSQRIGEASDIDVYWRYELWARQQQSRIDSIFNATGCIYAMRHSLAKAIPPDTLCDDAMIPLQVFLAGYRVIFDPEAVAFDYGQIAGGEFRRKLRTLAGVWQVWARLPVLFSRKNRMRFHFLPHKFGRLLLPWLLLMGFTSTLLMPAGWFRSSLLTLATLTVLISLLDMLLPRNFFLRRVSSPIRSFLVLNLASLLSVAVFIIPPEMFWRPTRISEAGSSLLQPEHPKNESPDNMICHAGSNVLKQKPPDIES